MNQFGVIFDMDGVLVDSSAAHLQAWSELGRRAGTPFTAELFAHTFGMHNAQIIPLWLPDASPERITSLADEKEELYREAAASTVEPLQGARELVQSLAAAGFRLAVGSSGPRANVEMIVRILDLKSCFAALSTGDDVTHGKPHPEVFLKAASMLGLSPEKCLVVEDAPQGIEAGKAAGMRVVAVTSSRGPEALGQADRIVASLALLNPHEVERLVAR